jgi:hypothetical protein
VVVFWLARSRKGRVPVVRLEREQDEVAARTLGSAGEVRDWAESAGFALLGQYRVMVGSRSQTMMVWQHENRPTFLYMLPTGPAPADGTKRPYSYAFATKFEEETGLSTCSSRTGHWILRPGGGYVQTFSVLSIDELWQRHQVGEAYVMKQAGVGMKPLTKAFEERYTESYQRELDYVCSLRFGRFRVPWQRWTRSRRRHDLTIEQLHRRGLVKIPQEVEPD